MLMLVRLILNWFYALCLVWVYNRSLVSQTSSTNSSTSSSSLPFTLIFRSSPFSKHLSSHPPIHWFIFTAHFTDSSESYTNTMNIDVVIAPPSLYLLLVREHLREGIQVASQNVFDKPNGAFTGEISVEQLEDSGINWTLVGHSERRVILQEDDTVSWRLFIFPSEEGNEKRSREARVEQ